MNKPGTASSDRRFVDPERLVCGGCRTKVRLAPPRYWQVSRGLPVPQTSHQDGTALCSHPVEVTR